MVGIGNYLSQALLDHVHGKATFSSPANIFVGFNTGDPGETGANELVVGSSPGYARVSTAAADWNSAGVSGSTTNANAIRTPLATGNGQTATHFSRWDALTVGNFLDGGALSASRVWTDGARFEFLAGSLTVDYNNN